MLSLHIPGTNKSPDVHFEKFSGTLTLSGKSSLENPTKFYEPLLKWMTKYIKTPSEKTTFQMHLEYFNSSSSKHIMKLLRVLENAQNEHRSKIVIEWQYDGDDGSMMEAGEDFQSVLSLDFNFVEEKE